MSGPRKAGPRKFLIIHPFGIGDVIFSLAAAEALVRRGHRVDYLCNERTEDLLRLCPAVSRIHRFDRAALRSDLSGWRWVRAARRYGALRAAMASERYDAALDLSMGREYAFLAFAAGIGRRIGWDFKGRGLWLTDRVPVSGFDRRSPRDAALELVRLADPEALKDYGPRPVPEYPYLNLPHDPQTGRWLNRLTGHAPWFVIAPGGGESWGKDAHYKRWPAEHWVELARQLKRGTRAVVIVLGSESEADLVESIAEQAAADPGGAAGAGDANGMSGGVGGTRVAAVVGESLDHVAALLSGAQGFIGTDGGLLHLANLLRVPTLGLYGPVSEAGYGPLESAAPTRVLTANVPCRPCYIGFRFTGCAHEKRCLTSISPAFAAEEFRQLLLSES
jgi:ADP-heptose:LPS heptosyltransferase